MDRFLLNISAACMFSLAIMGCSEESSTPGGAEFAPTPEEKSAVDPHFSIEKKIPEGEKFPNEIYLWSRGCKLTGSRQLRQRVDDQLTEAMEQTEKITFSSPVEGHILVVHRVVNKKTEDGEERLIYTSHISEASGQLEELKDKTFLSETDGSGEDFEGWLDDYIENFYDETLEERCKDRKKESSESTRSIGKYTMPNKQPIAAWQEVYVSISSRVCDNTPRSNTYRSIEVRSNLIPSLSNYFCGGVPVQQKVSYELEGLLSLSYTREILSSPILETEVVELSERDQRELEFLNRMEQLERDLGINIRYSYINNDRPEVKEGFQILGSLKKVSPDLLPKPKESLTIWLDTDKFGIDPSYASLGGAFVAKNLEHLLILQAQRAKIEETFGIKVYLDFAEFIKDGELPQLSHLLDTLRALPPTSMKDLNVSAFKLKLSDQPEVGVNYFRTLLLSGYCTLDEVSQELQAQKRLEEIRTHFKFETRIKNYADRRKAILNFPLDQVKDFSDRIDYFFLRDYNSIENIRYRENKFGFRIRGKMSPTEVVTLVQFEIEKDELERAHDLRISYHSDLSLSQALAGLERYRTLRSNYPNATDIRIWIEGDATYHDSDLWLPYNYKEPAIP
jgi:hypothetical protein